MNIREGKGLKKIPQMTKNMLHYSACGTYHFNPGDIMGPTLSNLKNLLRMPYGCGEQNMASWSPNIYVLQYLTNTNQLTEKIEEDAKRYMRSGEYTPFIIL